MSGPADQPQDPLQTVGWPVRTARTSIRRAQAGDEDAMWAYRSLDEVGRWIGHQPVDRADWHEVLATRLPTVLVVEVEGRVVGDLVLRVEDGWAQREVLAGARGVQAELGWVLDPTFAGRGLATEAVRALVRVCFEELGLRRVTATAFAANTSSCRLAERVGMRCESRTVRDALHRDLGWVDGVGYALLAEEWAALPPAPDSAPGRGSRPTRP